jgi:hypothetical protein
MWHHPTHHQQEKIVLNQKPLLQRLSLALFFLAA